MKRVQSHYKQDANNKKDILIGQRVRSCCKPPTTTIPESVQNVRKSKVESTNQQYLKGNVNKQQNIYSTDVERPKQRTKSTVSGRQPWGQLLNKHLADTENVFIKCDPLRTLHFLASELQTHMQTKLPEETSVQEIIQAIHSTLKRIPPEVASTVQLQTTPKSDLGEDKPKLSLSTHSRDIHELQKLIEGNTVKLEATCQHLEVMCGQLRDEKLSLETLLLRERTHSSKLEKKLNEIEEDQQKLNEVLYKKDEEVGQLKGIIKSLKTKFDEKCPVGDSSELRSSKLALERENQKLEHQLRLSAIEKEKYLAILAVRDRQIYEIRNEMAQLQQSVNEQLLELHNFATTAIPADIDEANANDRGAAISPIWPTSDNNKQQISDDETDCDD